MEKRKVGSGDIPGAYLQAFMKNYTLIKFTGESVNIICKRWPKYETCVVTEKVRKVLYLQFRKALYGCIQNGLLWYQTFTTLLKNMGFEINPYDPCVTNKIVDGSQCTIAWYVDDIKVSHAKTNSTRRNTRKH